jgi:hypothetical protein
MKVLENGDFVVKGPFANTYHGRDSEELRPFIGKIAPHLEMVNGMVGLDLTFRSLIKAADFMVIKGFFLFYIRQEMKTRALLELMRENYFAPRSFISLVKFAAQGYSPRDRVISLCPRQTANGISIPVLEKKMFLRRRRIIELKKVIEGPGQDLWEGGTCFLVKRLHRDYQNNYKILVN